MRNVSLVIPNRNHAEELQTSLACIVGQSRPFDEIIVIDDASTDHSLEVIETFAAQCPWLKLLRNDRQLGVPGTVNRGIKAASGDYVILASADERISTEMCGALMDAVARFPQARLVVSQYSEWDPARQTSIAHDRRPPLGMWYLEGEDPAFFSPAEFVSLLKNEFVWLSVNTALFRRDALLEAGGFDPDLRWHSDWFASYSIAFRHGFCAVPRSLAWFRLAEESYSGKGMRDRHAQSAVVHNLQRKLHAPENADLLAAMKSAPAALSPFMRWLLPVLAAQPERYPTLLPIARWWCGEVLKGRRPGVLVRLLAALRARKAGNGESG